MRGLRLGQALLKDATTAARARTGFAGPTSAEAAVAASASLGPTPPGELYARVVAATRDLTKHQDAPAVDQLTVRRVRESCAGRNRTGRPSKGPWQ